MQAPPVTDRPSDLGQVPHHPVRLICPKESCCPLHQLQKPQWSQHPARLKHLGTVASLRWDQGHPQQAVVSQGFLMCTVCL